MKRAAIGLRVHSGWTALVAVAVDKDGPRVLLRERPRLVETFTYEFRQPYHTAEKMPIDKARSFLAGVESAARRLAAEAIRSAQGALDNQGFALRASALLLASGKPLPDLQRILASHALIHTADGELFRFALLDAAERVGVAALAIRERQLLAAASTRLQLAASGLAKKLTALGKPVGAPWSKDEKFAALAAWLSLLPGGAAYRAAVPGALASN